MTYKVDDRVWQKLINSLAQSETIQVQAGFFDGKTPEIYNGKSEADIMTINEYGAKLKGGNIPPRRAIGKIARQKRKQLARLAGLQGTRMIRSLQPNLSFHGQLMKTAIADNINSPTGMRRNKASTISKKGFNNPLTETGHLGSSVDKREVRHVRNSTT